MNQKKLISLVIPVFNEEENIQYLYQRVQQVMAPLAERYDYELVFTDNHSEDKTFSLLRKLHEKDKRIRAFRFSRNFGYQCSILTGYFKSRGDAVIQLDCDLQDPPELIPDFIEQWEKGNEVVYGIRKSRQEGWLIHFMRKAFYRLINKLSEDELPEDAGDFRLVDRKVIDILAQYPDAQPYLRGTIAGLGFNQVGIKYDRDQRERGESKFDFSALISLALDGILNHSIIPLRVASLLGLAISFFTLLAIVVYFIGRIFYQAEWPAGFATIVIQQWASIGINALFLGVIGEYLGRIYKQVKRGPLTIVEASLDVTDVQPRVSVTSFDEGDK